MGKKQRVGGVWKKRLKGMGKGKVREYLYRSDGSLLYRALQLISLFSRSTDRVEKLSTDVR